MRIIILDTETISVSKRFIYDLGYIIYDTDKQAVIKTRDYVISQTWNNKPLMATAYYNDKKVLYIERLESGYCKKVCWGNAIRYLQRDIEKFKVEVVYAYNAKFDYKAFIDTCNLYKSKFNPLVEVPVKCLMEMAKPITQTSTYIDYCTTNNFLTKHSTPRPQAKAETMYGYFTSNPNFIEAHTALADCEIELEIFKQVKNLGISSESEPEEME